METTPNPSAWSRIVEILRPQLIERLQIRDLADPESTIEGIKKDIEFRGFNLWILVFSIVIASIGLNVDSTAVVIGAMLISPLMGPIMGFGLGVGINDAGTVRKSLTNLGVAAGIAVLSSAIYFLISPIDEAGSELFARTNPTFLDVLVALFGGLTGILAGSRKEKSNVIPGVAIATALMPQLCTAGVGFAPKSTGAEWRSYFSATFLCHSLNLIGWPAARGKSGLGGGMSSAVGAGRKKKVAATRLPRSRAISFGSATR